jgi:two-component system chemotaxis response regulator CheY
MDQNILVIDDSITIRDQVRSVLEGEGYGVSEAESGEAGIAKAYEMIADMLIIDVNMGEMNGLDMLSKIRKMPHYKKVPAFILTTESSMELVKRGREVGATAWIVKPFTPEVLLKGIRRVLNR